MVSLRGAGKLSAWSYAKCEPTKASEDEKQNKRRFEKNKKGNKLSAVRKITFRKRRGLVVFDVT